ncbi:MAG: hypothetical protein AB1921_08150 [Thermodesulfobacteriota bacterium]
MKEKAFLRILLSALALAVLFSGCVTDQAGKKAEAQKEPAPLYYDYGDVQVPPELSLDRKASFLYQAGGLSAGVLVLSGGMEPDAILKFFEKNMAKDNWTLKSLFKSERSIMLFSKENRWCIINVTRHPLATGVEIWVAPTMGGEGDKGGLYK